MVIHAFDVPYPRRVYRSLSEEEAADWSRRFQRQASRELANLLAKSLARAKVRLGDVPLWRAHIRCGSPRLVIKKAVENADTDLLVLGTRGFARVTHPFLGTVSGDVLRDVA
jgi:nucleotide-binding universal stress UspA family protein